MPVIDLNNTTAIYRGGQQIARLFRGVSEIWTETAFANLGVGTDTPIMFLGNSQPISLSYMWWGGPGGDEQGTNSHTIWSSTRGDYAGAVSTAAGSVTLPGIGLATKIGINVLTQEIQNTFSGEWGDYGDPVNDAGSFDGGALLMFEGESLDNFDWIADLGGRLAQPYVWRSNAHRTSLLRDLSFEYGHVARFVAAGAVPYLGGSWPPLIEEAGGNANIPARDAEWRTRFSSYDLAHRYRRDWLRAELAANSLANDLWILPAHLAVARWYDDDLADNLPTGITSHRDFHADDTTPAHADDNGGKHPWMLNRTGNYCIRAMAYEVIEGQDALTLPDNATEGVTGEVAAYLRQVAKDIVSDYAPAGRGGSSYASPGLLTATAQPPQDALPDCVAYWRAGDADETVIGTTDPVRWGGVIINFDDVPDMADNEQVQIFEFTGAASSRVVMEVLKPDFRSFVPTLRIETFNEAGDWQGSTVIDAPTSGDYIWEFVIDDKLNFRLVNLEVAGTDATKITSPQYVTDAPAYIPGCATFTVNTVQTRFALTAAYLAETFPGAQAMVDLNAWIDSLSPTWKAWNGVPEAATDYDTAALAYYEAGDPIVGSDATVTGINLRGTGSLTLSTTAGTSVGNSPDGLVFSNGAYLRITGISPDTADGMVVVVEATFDDLAGSGVPYNFGNVATVLKANGGPVLMRANSNGFSQSVYTTTVGERIVAAIELDAVADNIRYWNLNTESIVSTAYTLPSLAPTYLNIGQGMTGTVHRLAVIPRPSGGALSVTLEQVLADFLAGV